jgi:hypothetical protein
MNEAADKTGVPSKEPVYTPKFKRSELLIVGAIFVMPLAFLLWMIVGTFQRMDQFHGLIRPGMTVRELLTVAGQPDVIVHRDEPLMRARRSYVIPVLDDLTALYFYPKEGIPYYNVYVFVDERSRTVIRSDVESLGW